VAIRCLGVVLTAVLVIATQLVAVPEDDPEATLSVSRTKPLRE